MAKMTEKTLQIFEYVRAHEVEDITANDVAQALGLTSRSVNGSFTSFVKKGLGYREEAETVTDDGAKKIIKFLKLTDAGRVYDNNAVED